MILIDPTRDFPASADQQINSERCLSYRPKPLPICKESYLMYLITYLSPRDPNVYDDTEMIMFPCGSSLMA